MVVIGWQKRNIKEKENWRNYNEDIVDLYIFEKPEIVEYSTGFIGVHPINGRCIHYHFIDGSKVENFADGGVLNGIGIHKDCLFELNKTSLNELAKKTGINEKVLGEIINI